MFELRRSFIPEQRRNIDCVGRRGVTVTVEGATAGVRKLQAEGHMRPIKLLNPAAEREVIIVIVS